MPITAQIDGIGNLEFPDGTSPDVVHATVQKVVMQHNAPKPLSGTVPGTETDADRALTGPKDPEYKPFLSASNILDEGTGVLKSLAPIATTAGHLLGKVPVIGKPVIDPQKISDLEDYAKPNNKGEQFGKVLGSIGQALPALVGGGEFAGGLYDELAPALGPSISAAGGVLGRVAGTAAKELAKETLKYGPLYYAARKMWGH